MFDPATGHDPISEAYRREWEAAVIGDGRAELERQLERQRFALASRSHSAKARFDREQDRATRDLERRHEHLKAYASRLADEQDLDGWVASQAAANEAYRNRLAHALNTGDVEPFRKSASLGHLGLK